MNNTISPAEIMNYCEIVGEMPPRYEKGKRYYQKSIEGELYTIDILKDTIPQDMNIDWAIENL